MVRAGKRAAAVAAAVVAAAIAAGCGSEAPPRPQDCAKAGVSSPSIPRAQRKEGTCLQTPAQLVTIVNRRTLLVLPELSARLGAVGVRDRAGGYAADGRFVDVTLALQSRLTGTVTLKPEQFALQLGGDSDAERYPVAAAIADAIGAPYMSTGVTLTSGARVTLRLLFDVPPSRARQLRANGTLWVHQFSDGVRGAGRPTRGVIRIYK